MTLPSTVNQSMWLTEYRKDGAITRSAVREVTRILYIILSLLREGGWKGTGQAQHQRCSRRCIGGDFTSSLSDSKRGDGRVKDSTITRIAVGDERAAT